MEVATPPCSIFFSRWMTGRGGPNPPLAFDELASGCIDRVPPVQPPERLSAPTVRCFAVAGKPIYFHKTRLTAARFFSNGGLT